MPLDVATLGQVFTPVAIVERMLFLRRRQGRVLEPSCGNGAFFHALPEDTRVGIEVDPLVAPQGAIVSDFFAYPITETFDTIIGNPPFVRFQDISPGTQVLLPPGFDRRTNLYVFFLFKCLDHLRPGGEMIFINPRDFFQATHARMLNDRLMREGTITHVEDLGDAQIFKGYTPNCVIWRFQKDLMTHVVDDGRRLLLHEGQILFAPDREGSMSLGDVFDVRVGAVSGLDAAFVHPEGQMFVHSTTLDTGEARRILYPGDAPHPYLMRHKADLLARRGSVFTDANWWRWIRTIPRDTLGRPRVYVPVKTRRVQPFFTHSAEYFEGSILALFPKDPTLDPAVLARNLNGVDWAAQGFQSGGRLLFGQRSLSGARLPPGFLPGP